MDDTTLEILNVIEDKYIAIKELSNRFEGYYTCTRVLLERMNSNLVESQISSAEYNLIIMKRKLINKLDESIYLNLI